MNEAYLPVDPDFFEIIENEKQRKDQTVVHYFGPDKELRDERGNIKDIITVNKREEYLRFENGVQVRLDRIIVINGRPGPAFEEYDGYALACLDCSGGMDLDE
ncbi:MAG: hypothetical protein AB2L24_08830 [Mangrovibacterium sp.]|jgi:hypothetical protein